uniref:RRM domain-containing protein n=1 Tax=Neogobius melanostomus TaxID=47308 RepID=A0A8C6SEW6_9GOBI
MTRCCNAHVCPRCIHSKGSAQVVITSPPVGIRTVPPLKSRLPGRRKRRDRGKLFIGAEVFGKYGILEEVDVVRDTDTGRSRGFGFVKYADAKRAEDALEAMKGRTLDGGESGSGPPNRLGGCPVGESVCIQSTPAELHSPRMALVPQRPSAYQMFCKPVGWFLGSLPQGRQENGPSGITAMSLLGLRGNGTAASRTQGASSLTTAMFRPWS